MAELTGQTFAGYEILAKLGQGGMGAVYKARQPVLNRIVALKVMSPHLSDDPAFVSRFIREASSAAKLNHANMVLVHTAGQCDGTYYIVMEFVDGLSLQDHIHNHGRLDAHEAIATTVYVAQALQYAWDTAQIIHRDIKPANIFLSQAGEVKVGDLGLAKSVGESSGGMTATGLIVGSPNYISPEQARGVKDIDFRADIYSLGCTLYHMLTGHPPYDGADTMSIMMKHVNDPPPAIFKVLPNCPVPLGMLVGKMLAKNPNARPQSYEDLIATLLSINDKLGGSSGTFSVRSAQAAPAPPPTPATAGPAATPSGMIAAMFTDIVNSTRMKGAMPGASTHQRDDAYRRQIKAPHDALMNRLAGQAGGRLVNNTGDGFFYTFADAEDAVLCGLLIQRELVAHPVATPLGPLRVRIGLHVGSAQAQDGNYTAAVCDKAARVCAQAGPGEVMISRQTYVMVEQLRDVSFRRIGPVEMKGLEKPEYLYAVTAGASAESAPPPGLTGIVSSAKVRVGKPAAKGRAWAIGGIVAAATLLLGGLFFWSPWKQSSQNSNTPSLQSSASAALSLLGNVYTNAVGAEMVYIPPGEFMLGSTKEEQARAVANGATKESIQREGEAPRKATIKQGFWMGRTEVTVGQWKQFVKETAYVTDGEKGGGSLVVPRHEAKAVRKKGVNWRNPDFGFELRDDHPVSCISWNDAVAFCAWLTEKERKGGRLQAGLSVRLPTEAEWEYACRAGTQTEFWWGDSKEGGKGRLNWNAMEDGYEFVAPVDSFGVPGRNRFGLADMLGNVSEWCLDRYDATKAHADQSAGNVNWRVIRGGGFNSGSTSARCASVQWGGQMSCNYVGFRVAMGVDVADAGGSTPSTSSPTSSTPSPQHSAASPSGILAPAETRVSALTTNPKVGEVYTLPLGSNVTMELMGIPPGEFMLGSTKEEQEWAVAEGAPKEHVKLEGDAPRKATIKKGFWMGRTEVTVDQWKRFVRETGYVTDGEKAGASRAYQGQADYALMPDRNWRDPNFGFKPQDDHPVCCVSWDDAIAFCKWATERERKAGRLSAGQIVRLPTEAEWEYACRAGTQSKFWWGEAKTVWHRRENWGNKSDGFQVVAPVGSFGEQGRNQFGLADMLGNLKEWCLDEFDATQAHEDLWIGNPQARVFRGGWFDGGAAVGRCACRQGGRPSLSHCTIGFRIVMAVDVGGATNSTPSTSSPTSPTPSPQHSAASPSGILAPAETRVSALTTNPKVGEVYTLPLGSNVTMELTGIPPGEFMMGSTPEERAWALANGCDPKFTKYEGDAPRKTAVKQGLWLGRTEVTVDQWKLFVAATGYVTDGEKKGASWGPIPGKWGGLVKGASWKDPKLGIKLKDNHPACCISWNDAVAFCEWLNERESKAGRLPPGCEVRLPTEAEWEYACRAGSQTKFWWGDTQEDGDNRLNWRGKDDGFEFVSPVDNYKTRGRNKFGLADMLGNVREWCLDEFDPAGAHEELYKGNSSGRVVRGGSFAYPFCYARCACRVTYDPSFSDSNNGFRVAVGVSR